MVVLLSAAGMSLAAAGAAAQQIGKITQPLTTSSKATDWTAQKGQVPVCWETAGWDREKKIMRDALAATWEYYANVNFTGWGMCPATGKVALVRIVIAPMARNAAGVYPDSGAGGASRVGTVALSSADDKNPGMNFSFAPDGAGDRGRIEYVTVHEFGHLLAFEHEQDAPGNTGPARCNRSIDPATQKVAVPITPYDRDSIMNYCNPDGNLTGYLTDVDIAGAQKIYGLRRSATTRANACASAPVHQMVSLAAPWNDAGQTTIAVYATDGQKFPGWRQWMVREGGWGDDVKWMSGDFDGDGKSDIAAAWNNGGNNTLTLRRSTGSGFTHEHWLVSAGGWIPTTRWMSGDFNGDGKTDIAGVWNNGGMASIAVFPSDGRKFAGWTQWSDRDGGWSDDIKWFPGDFNGDGKTDIAAAWNNNGRVTITVRLSLGNRFSQVHWNVDAGRWFNSAVFMAGDFNGDGRDDVAELWNEIGTTSINVFRSTGAAFGPAVAWSTRDGGWSEEAIRWIPGDFNGDGKTDIAAAWKNGGNNTLTVRLSDGARFGQVHWLVNAGGWIDSTAWCAGRFAGNESSGPRVTVGPPPSAGALRPPPPPPR